LTDFYTRVMVPPELGRPAKVDPSFGAACSQLRFYTQALGGSLGNPVPPKVDSKFGSTIAAIALAIGCACGTASSAQLGKSPSAAATSNTASSLNGTKNAAATGPVKPDVPKEPLVVFVDHKAIETKTSASTVAGALADAQVHVGPRDIVTPRLKAPMPMDGIVHVERVVVWTQHICSSLSPRVINRTVSTMAKNTTRIVSAGHAGLRQTTIRFTSVDGQRAQERVLETRTLVQAKPRIVAVGTASTREMISQRIDSFARNTFTRTGGMFSHVAMAMIATAYTAFCDTCSGTGLGASGMRVHHGVVAVDPRLIPLGSRMFIPGYGQAIAGDTGGAIIGHRIDLAFNSYEEAIRFGRRPINIYLLP
jgi:3D (Asp-Asp-Asp) domain-containing protein